MKRQLKRLVKFLSQGRDRETGYGLPAFATSQQQPIGKEGDEIGPIYVFIRAWNRPLYLWACLDSLYRAIGNCQYPCRFILIDNSSTDPQVSEIVAGFERRHFFHAVHFMNQNSPRNQTMAFVRYRRELGKYFVVLDADIAVEPTEPCWLTRLIAIAEQRPKLAILGSVVDTRDFIATDWAERVAPEIPEQQLSNLIKTNSRERRQTISEREVIAPFEPAGRLLLLRTEAIDQIGLPIGNIRLCRAAKQAGWDWAIATGVRHRHLSLLNFFDYPDYDFAQLSYYLSGQ